jgi:riboflavin kinase / FMN adenylyltransferase
MKTQHTFSGVVVEGNKRGRLLGYPTANMHIQESLPEGVYASTVRIDDTIYKAATFIGASKTFDDYEYKLESYIFDFNQDIYDKEIVVSLYSFIRGNKKFDSEEALVKQMVEDVENVKTALENIA